MKKRNVLLIFGTALIASFSIAGTVGFLTDSKKSSNVYSIGKISINLDETDVDELGNPIEGANRVNNNKYHLMPGYTYIKDPVITIQAGSEDSYIRLLITVNRIQELKQIFGNDFEPEMLVNNMNNKIWVYTSKKDNQDNSNTYEYRYYKKINGFEQKSKKTKQIEPLFESFTVPNFITKEQLETIKDLQITVIGQAIQAKGFENDTEAWEAFELQF